MFDWMTKGKVLLQSVKNNAVIRKTADFFEERRTAARVLCFLSLTVAVLAVSLASTGITLGFSVDYAGETIATVRHKSIFLDAKKMAAGAVKNHKAVCEIRTPKYRLTLTVSDRLDNAATLAGQLLRKSEGIVYAAVLEVNGQAVVCGEESVLQNALQQKLNRYHLAGAENTASFIDEVKVTPGYYLKADLQSAEEIAARVDMLSVKTVATVSSETEIPFEKKTVKTAGEYLGYVEVTTAGVTGLNRKTESIEMLNGAETARTVLSEVTVRQPVTEVTTIGTAKVTASQTQQAVLGNGTFLLPLSPGSFRVSSYYGDGRNHRGIDMCAAKGSPIYAVAAGTVTYTGFRNDYGYSVVVDHGNGLSTRYAHASMLCVKQGDTVSAGQMLAAVGRTGYATGDHLHFEVMVGGTRVNPQPYLGI